MQNILAELARRGTLVAPDAIPHLERAPEVAQRLLDSGELPFLLTAAFLAAQPRVEPTPAPPVPAASTTAPPSAAPSRAPAPPASAAVMPTATPAASAADAPRPAPTALAPAPIRQALAPEPLALPSMPRGTREANPTTESAAGALVEVVPRAVPPPFTPDDRGMMLEMPELPFPTAPVGGPLPARPRLLEPYAHRIDVLSDVTGNSTCEGAITDFTRYFNDRLNKIRKMLRQRREMVGFVPMAKARQGGTAEVKLIGVVVEVRTTKNGHRLIELEDETGSVVILAPASDAQLILEADTVIEDEVIGVTVKPPGRGDLFILQHLVRPDVPMSSPGRRSPNASAVAILSDLHFGAKTFLHEDWERFVKWMNLEWGDSRMKAMARKVRYIVVNGDVVDGIGIFPGQEEELAIVDAYDQYRYAGEQLNRIRDDVRIFVLPGNHDLVRPAEPQPALPEKFRRLFPETVTHIGNPCKLSIEGMEFLAYHGRSMDDWITRVSGLSYEDPIRAMKEMILRRHMVPVYGLRTPIAPEHKDYLTIDTVPDVFVTGHVHAAGLDTYRGVTLINASCWQSQTAYQKMHGFMPEPSKVPVVELDTGKPWMVDFHRGKPSGVDVIGKSKFGSAFREPEKLDDPGQVV